MKVFVKKFSQELPISLEKAWNYFSNPGNLREITPKELDFVITTQDLKSPVYPGQLISYTVRPLAGLKVSWLSEIASLKEHEFFVDLQVSGPYKYWHHEHRFYQKGEGVLMEDTIHYALPFGFLGRWLNWMLVSSRLEKIFEYRKSVLQNLFK